MVSNGLPNGCLNEHSKWVAMSQMSLQMGQTSPKWDAKWVLNGLILSTWVTHLNLIWDPIWAKYPPYGNFSSPVWPDEFDAALWPFALEYATWIFNHILQADQGNMSPEELFSKTKTGCTAL